MPVHRGLSEDAEWLAATCSWASEDQLRFIRREQAEGRRFAEIERWLKEDGWRLVDLVKGEGPVQRWLLQ